MHEIGALSPTAFLITSAMKVVHIFTIVMLLTAAMTLLERWLAGWIQDRMGPNRVGPKGILQPIADGLKNILKEETFPDQASRIYFLLAPALSLVPALVAFAVIPFAAPLPTQWGLVEMVIADVPIGVLFVLAFASLGVYGIVMGGWASANKYALLGGLRASAQMVSYEVALALSLIPVFLLVGNVTLTQMIWTQQGELGMWLALPLSLSFLLFILSAFAENNRLPFDVPEAEEELVTGYHTEYSSMKFSMYFIAEYAAMFTNAALMATIFLGGWDIPFWSGDNMVVSAPGVVTGAEPAVWKTLLTLAAFAVKTAFFIFVYMWVRWTVPRFRYDQIMSLGWKIMLPVSLAYIVLVSGTVLVLDTLQVPFGFWYGLALTAVSLVATAGFIFVLDSDRVIRGGSSRGTARVPKREAEPAVVLDGEPEAVPDASQVGAE